MFEILYFSTFLVELRKSKDFIQIVKQLFQHKLNNH